MGRLLAAVLVVAMPAWGCRAEPVQAVRPDASVRDAASEPWDADAARRDPDDASTCGDARCEFDWECVDGGCCPLQRACLQGCCREDEFCNVYQCFQPLLCGPGLPPCPTLTYCEKYGDGVSNCAKMGESWREHNREFCARQRDGLAWLESHHALPGASRAVGTCFPEMAPHRLHNRWYRSVRP